MSGIKGVVKDGWHPKGKDGGKESWRGDFKGINQVAGWVGKGKGKDDPASNHTARPLNSLKDPSSFGPPPKRHTGGTPGLQGTTQASPVSGQAQYQSGGYGEQAQPETRKPPPPPVPYRADRTGLATNHLPKPPVRHVDQPADESIAATKPRPKPSVPPRLPARKPSGHSDAPPPPPSYDTAMRDPPSHGPASSHQGAISRLGKAGVSVPGLGIGESQGNGDGQSPSPSSRNASSRGQLSELQSRFSKMSPSSPNNSSANTPTEGTTTEQKQDALRTAHSFHNDPSSVSATDARNAASTANNFRERHGDQVAAGKKKMTGLNEKYGITKRINGFIEDQSSPADQQPSAGNRLPPPVPPPHPNSNNQAAGLNNRRPPPPPPPPKRQELQSAPVGDQSRAVPPPPLPLGTKPRH
ncbi:hypothetical protein FQN54_001307 [Arachnomyces sp. PD_36]|nr:hypothetical protein FQN54_001307 [Arachnomyces sp. PD_36]